MFVNKYLFITTILAWHFQRYNILRMYPQSLEWVIRQPNFSGTIPAQQILVVQEFLAKQSKKRGKIKNCG
jgi:hypothetical protein